MKTRLLIYGAAALLLFGLYWAARFRIEELAHGRAEGQAMAAEAKLHGGIVGRRVSEQELERRLSETQRKFLHAIKTVAPKARPESLTTQVVGIEDSPAGKVVETPGGPSEWRDEHERYRLVLPSGPFFRSERFELTTLAIQSPDGKVRVAKTEFREFNPKTGAEIPSTGATVETKLDFVREKSPAPPILHLRALAAVDHRVAPGAGAEFVNLERTGVPVVENLTLSALGYWKTEKTKGRAVGQLGYRIPESNVTLGGYLGATIPSGSLVGGVGVAFQVTR